MPVLPEKYRHIVVEGPIGAGKTSLARRIADVTGAALMLEAPEDNPFLAKFYRDMARYALPTQLFFLFQRIHQLAELKQPDMFKGGTVGDFLFEKDPLFARLTLTDDELGLYEQMYRHLKPQAPVPDLVIYLQAEPATLIERVRRRGHAHEQPIAESYLVRLGERYTRFFHHYDAAPLMIVNSDHFNFVDADDDFALLLKRVREMRGRREYFNRQIESRRPEMDVIDSVADLRARLAREPRNVLVPTMGNLHEGHIQLVGNARRTLAGDDGRGPCTVVSIFVNRMQFGPRDDFDKYPRTFAGDCEKLAAAGCDVVFAPGESEIYPEPQTYAVEPPEIANILDGAVRPGHFRGVATVVLKLFNMVAPKAAVFGKKDYQQCIVLKNMVRQLALPIQIILADTVRASDGLALSSRNGYLSPAERAEAPALNRALLRAREELREGKRDYLRIELDAMAHLAGRGWQPDYIAIRRQADLLPPIEDDRDLVIVGAAKLGATRLIENLEVSI